MDSDLLLAKISKILFNHPEFLEIVISPKDKASYLILKSLLKDLL